MGELSDAEIDAALDRGRWMRRHEPRAAAARYDAEADRVVVELVNGSTFLFAPRLAQGLELASAEQLSAVEILGAGSGMHWEDLDVDLAMPGLLSVAFGPGTRRRGRSVMARQDAALPTRHRLRVASA